MGNIFTYLMENRYNPAFEDNCILLDINGNASVLEYENAVLTLRTFFTIEEEEYDMFLEASNYAMLKSFMIKPVIMEDMKSIMFSCETFCESFGDFKRFFPKMVEYSRTGLEVHKNEMRELLKATQMLSRKNPVIDEEFIETGISSGKLLT
jgi:hypothetical protein